MKILLAIIISLCSITMRGQELQGTYWEGTDSIAFNDNRVVFNIKGNEGLGILYTGEGPLEMVEDYILIHTEAYQGNKTKVDMVSALKKDTIQLQFFDDQGYSLKGIRAEFLNKKNKNVDLSISNEHGIVLYTSSPKVSSIKVSDLLYDKVILDYHPDKDYTVHLVKNRVVEDKTVVFKLEKVSDDKFKMRLLSIDYKKKKPSVSHLNKLEKKTEAIIDRTRTFEKPLY